MNPKGNDSQARALWEQRRRQAISVGRGWVKTMLKDYKEPRRAGVLKGLSIGFSRKKRKAGLLNILYPLLQIKEIARMAGVSPGVLMFWRVQKNFQDVEKEACKIFGEWVRNTIQIGWEKLEGSQRPTPFLTMTGTIPGIESYSHLVLINLLHFWNPIVSEAIFNLLDQKGHDDLYVQLRTALIESLYFYKHKSLDKWIKSPTYVQNIKRQITQICTLLVTFIKLAPLLKGGTAVVTNDEPEVIQGLNKLIDSVNEWKPNMITEWLDLLLKEIDLLGGTGNGRKNFRGKRKPKRVPPTGSNA